MEMCCGLPQSTTARRLEMWQSSGYFLAMHQLMGTLLLQCEGTVEANAVVNSVTGQQDLEEQQSLFRYRTF